MSQIRQTLSPSPQSSLGPQRVDTLPTVDSADWRRAGTVSSTTSTVVASDSFAADRRWDHSQFPWPSNQLALRSTFIDHPGEVGYYPWRTFRRDESSASLPEPQHHDEVLVSDDAQQPATVRKSTSHDSPTANQFEAALMQFVREEFLAMRSEISLLRSEIGQLRQELSMKSSQNLQQ